MRCLGPSNNKDTKDKSGKVENIPSTSLDEFGDDSTKMYGSDNSVLSRMVLPPCDVPLAMVDEEILNQLRTVRAWLTVEIWILDLLVWGRISPPPRLDFLPKCFNLSLNVFIFEGFGKLDAKRSSENDFSR